MARESPKQLQQRTLYNTSYSILFLLVLSNVYVINAWYLKYDHSHHNTQQLRRQYNSNIYRQRRRQLILYVDAKAGSFFNPVPEPSKDENMKNENNNNNKINDNNNNNNNESISKANQPSTINGIPIEQVNPIMDFGLTIQAARQRDPISRKQYVGIGTPSLNDVTKPEYDDQGYTLYVDETTGTKSRVFDALIQYPCNFTIKIVGKNEPTFIPDILNIVANTCQISSSTTTTTTSTMIEITDATTTNNTTGNERTTTPITTTSSIPDNSMKHSIKYNGKWVSITIDAPVLSSQMLYAIYENIDKDPRVKFKF